MSLADDRVIADPFVLTAGTVELLRARQFSATGRRWRRRRRGRHGRRLRALRRASAL
jgi:hypothetical protein